MRSTCFLFSRISSRTSIILVRRSFTSCFTSFFFTSVSFFLPQSSSSSTSQSLANLRKRSICLQICSILLSSLCASCCGCSPSAPSSGASSAPSAWGSSGASLMTSRTRSLPVFSLLPMSRMSATATRQASIARSTSFSPSSMRLAISTSPSRVSRLHAAHLAQVQAHRVVRLATRLVVLVLLLLVASCLFSSSTATVGLISLDCAAFCASTISMSLSPNMLITSSI